MVRKALNISSHGRGFVRALSVPLPYNLHGRRIKKEGVGKGRLRYAAINKLAARERPLPPVRAGREGFLNRALSPT